MDENKATTIQHIVWGSVIAVVLVTLIVGITLNNIFGCGG